MNAAFDAAEFKAATRQEWDRHAKGWDAASGKIESWLREPTDAMLSMAEIGLGARVLDVAAGAGGQTLAIAERVGPNGFVLATDLSAAILQFAQDNARRARYSNIAVQTADGEDLDVD